MLTCEIAKDYQNERGPFPRIKLATTPTLYVSAYNCSQIENRILSTLRPVFRKAVTDMNAAALRNIQQSPSNLLNDTLNEFME